MTTNQIKSAASHGTTNSADFLKEEPRQQAFLTEDALKSAIFNSADFSSIAIDGRCVIQIFNVDAQRLRGDTARAGMNKISPSFEALVFKATIGGEDLYELTYIRKDGSRFPAIVSVTALRDAQNAIIGYLLIGTDNTARKQIEGERMKLNQRLRDLQFYTRSLIESNIDAIMTTDPQGIITDVNKQMETLTGCTRDELIGAPFKIHFTDPERAEAVIKQVLSEGKITNYELTVRSRDGAQTVASLNAAIFYDRERHPLGVVAAARDITECKTVEQERLAAELFAKATLDATSAQICVLDNTGKILEVNRAWRDFAAKSTAEPQRPNLDSGVGSNYLAICDAATGPGADEAKQMADSIRKVLKGELAEFTMEYPCDSPTDKRWFVARVTRFRGASGNLVMAHEDVTALKLSELRKQQINRVEKINHVLQMLAANAALPSVLDAVACAVESINPHMLCSILVLDEDGKHLHLGAGPSLPVLFNQAMADLVVGLDAGPLGMAIASGERVIVANIEGDPWWMPYLKLARGVGIAACWSQPILSAQGAVLGLLTVYQRQAGQPTTADLQTLQDKARLAAIAIEKTRSEARLQLAANVFTHAREGIMITDAAGTIVEVNETFSRITGYSYDEAVGQNPRLFNSGRQTPEFYTAMWAALTGKGHWYGEVWNIHKNGDLYTIMITISAVRDGTGTTQNYVALFSDITSFKEHEQQLEHIAHYDALTDLPNRLLLADRLQRAMIQSQRRNNSLAVAFLDLDGFKAVNDTHGHDVGDELLVALAPRMKAALRDGDTLARIGGDEFLAVLVDLAHPEECEPVLTRLLQAIAEPITVRDLILNVSASIGFTLYPQDGGEADLLMRQADQAMYTAKQAGRNRYHLFDLAHDVAIQTQNESLEQIRRAVDRKEFVLFYQPKVNMKTHQVRGVEALIRWQHPARGLLLPGAFLSVIDDHPIGVTLGKWVIDTALQQMSDWHAVGLDLSVSVNIGAHQLQQNDFMAHLASALTAHPDISPRYLELEVLETSGLKDMTKVSAIMHACRELGVHFALDDFGTGYSSLSYLKRLPAEVIKIDQSFVRDMLEDPDDMAIVKGIIGLAAAFRREVIAEGVETVAQGEQLLRLDCELVQGYGIARPMPASELPAWVTAWPSEGTRFC